MAEDKNEVRKTILEEFLHVVCSISDKSFQERIWIRGEGPEVDDFTETVCDFFDLGECIFDRYEEYNLTEQQQEILEAFRKKFETFADNNDFPQEFIDTPEWEEIMHMAKEVLKAFNFQKKIGLDP